MTSDLASLFAQAAELIEQADGLVIAAGAGMGVDSGLPDFRGNDGFWRAYPALRDAGLEFHKIASPAAFASDPARAWGFYGHRLALYRRTMPHPGFAMLQRWSGRMPHGATVFTSNVDGQFQKAGFDEAMMHECHGSIHHMQCGAPCSKTIWPADGFDPQVDQSSCTLLGSLPRCPRCDGLVRPNILMFNDGEWLAQRTSRQSARQHAWLAKVDRPLVIEIGAGSAIPSVRHVSHAVVRECGGRLIRINPTEFAVPTGRDVGLPCTGLAALLELDRLLSTV
jgi:NAD-dependent SIR2 family protein deacetylase